MTEPVWSVTGHRPGCGQWGSGPSGECDCFDDLDPDEDYDGSDYYVDGDTGW